MHEKLKLLVVERKLISNRGHHHTQVRALQSVFPDADIHILAGERYDGFLGEAVGIISEERFKLCRLRSKLLYGSVLQRLKAGFKLLFSNKRRLPSSPYGQEIAVACGLLKMSAKDMIVVPTADLASLESIADLAVRLKDDMPKVLLRILSATMAEEKGRLLERRLRAALAALPSNVKLFTETEEMASYFRKVYKLNIVGGLFMPCSFVFSDFIVHRQSASNTFRVGVLGAPRVEKGSRRVVPIVREVAKLREASAGKEIEFVVQGSEKDFSQTGVYGSISGLPRNSGVIITPLSDRLSPSDFQREFQSLDMVLLPYDISIYGLQGSGVIQDAVVAMKPIVYSEGMAMAHFLKHGNAMAATSDAEFAKALIDIYSKNFNYAEGVVEAARFFEDLLTNLPAKLIS